MRDIDFYTNVPLPGATGAVNFFFFLYVDDSNLAMNVRVRGAVPKMCQLAETKPFVGPLSPTDGDRDSK